MQETLKEKEAELAGFETAENELKTENENKIQQIKKEVAR